MATTTITVDGISYNIDDFEIGPALAGNTLFAGEVGDTPAYYPVTEFKLSKDNYAVEYGYQAKIQNQTWKFNEFGEELHGTYQLYLGTATIDTHAAGDNQAIGTPGASGTQYFTLTSLNYRENIAVQVLNAMIYHVPDPISYDNAAIKLLVRKAFAFSEEFMSQALTIRTQNATYEDGQIVPNESSTEEILASISNNLNQLKGAFMVDATQSTPADSVLNELTQIKTQQQNIATALTGTGGTGIAAQITQIATNTAKINDVKDALIDSSNPNNPVNRIDNIATVVNNQGSDITAIKNAVTNNGTSYVENNGIILSDIKDALTMTYPNNAQMTNAELLNSINTFASDIKRGLVNEANQFYTVDEVASINGKLGGN